MGRAPRQSVDLALAGLAAVDIVGPAFAALGGWRPGPIGVSELALEQVIGQAHRVRAKELPVARNLVVIEGRGTHWRGRPGLLGGRVRTAMVRGAAEKPPQEGHRQEAFALPVKSRTSSQASAETPAKASVLRSKKECGAPG